MSSDGSSLACQQEGSHEDYELEIHSVACDYEQGGLFYSTGPHGKLHQPKHSYKAGRGFGGEKNAGEWTEKVEMRPIFFLAMGKECMAIFWLQALKGEHVSSGFSTEGTLISASTVLHCSLLPQESSCQWRPVTQTHTDVNRTYSPASGAQNINSLRFLNLKQTQSFNCTFFLRRWTRLMTSLATPCSNMDWSGAMSSNTKIWMQSKRHLF